MDDYDADVEANRMLFDTGALAVAGGADRAPVVSGYLTRAYEAGAESMQKRAFDSAAIATLGCLKTTADRVGRAILKLPLIAPAPSDDKEVRLRAMSGEAPEDAAWLRADNERLRAALREIVTYRPGEATERVLRDLARVALKPCDRK